MINLSAKYKVLNSYSFLRYEKRRKMWKIGWFELVRLTQSHWK